MNLSANKIFLLRKATIYTALTFALAITVLVLSCPLSRLLQSDFVLNASNATKANQTKINQRTGVHYSFTDKCSIAAEGTVLIKPVVAQQPKLRLPLYLSNITSQTGFDINSFLSRINYSHIQLVSSQHSTFPLFLQHLRLLI